MQELNDAQPQPQAQQLSDGDKRCPYCGRLLSDHRPQLATFDQTQEPALVQFEGFPDWAPAAWDSVRTYLLTGMSELLKVAEPTTAEQPKDQQRDEPYSSPALRGGGLWFL